MVVNHRERELAAIRHQTPDHIPVDVIGIDTCVHADKVVAEPFGLNEEEPPS